MFWAVKTTISYITICLPGIAKHLRDPDFEEPEDIPEEGAEFPVADGNDENIIRLRRQGQVVRQNLAAIIRQL